MRSVSVLAVGLALMGSTVAQDNSTTADSTAADGTAVDSATAVNSTSIAAASPTQVDDPASPTLVPTPSATDPLASATAASAAGAYPTWVTNDYNCVYGCLSSWQGTNKPPVTSDMLAAAYECVGAKCDNSTMAGNYYEAGFLIQLFNETGSFSDATDSTPGVNKTGHMNATTPLVNGTAGTNKTGSPNGTGPVKGGNVNGTSSAFLQAGASWVLPVILPALAALM